MRTPLLCFLGLLPCTCGPAPRSADSAPPVDNAAGRRIKEMVLERISGG